MRAGEYAALQGTPHVLGRSNTSARIAYGDAVTVPAVRWIGANVLEPLLHRIPDVQLSEPSPPGASSP